VSLALDDKEEIMIRKYAVAAAATLVLCSGAIASTAVSLESDNALQIRLLSGSSYPQYEAALSRSIRNAPRGAAVRLETDRWQHFGRPVSEALRDRADVRFTIDYKNPDDACTAPVSSNAMVGTLSAPDGTASFPVLCLAFAHDETEVLSKWKPKDHAALARMSTQERHYYMKTLRKEDRIRRDIIAASAAQGGRLYKLDYRLKSPASTYEKLYLREQKMPIETLTDLVRYTVLFDTADYSQGVSKMLRELSSRGYELGTLWNAWKEEKRSYRGINVVFCDPTNQFVEVQIHTPESAASASETHGIYEQMRLQPADSPEWNRLNALSLAITSKVPVPDGVKQFDTYRRPFNPEEFLKEREKRGGTAPVLH
jgi:hypothetical protein